MKAGKTGKNFDRILGGDSLAGMLRHLVLWIDDAYTPEEIGEKLRQKGFDPDELVEQIRQRIGVSEDQIDPAVQYVKATIARVNDLSGKGGES